MDLNDTPEPWHYSFMTYLSIYLSVWIFWHSQFHNHTYVSWMNWISTYNSLPLRFGTIFFHFFSVPVKLREVHLKPNNVPSTAEDGLSTSEEIVFYCFPMLDGIVDPHTVVVDVEWWVEDQLVIEESFNLKAKSSGILQPQFWKMGQTVSWFCLGNNTFLLR